MAAVIIASMWKTQGDDEQAILSNLKAVTLLVSPENLP